MRITIPIGATLMMLLTIGISGMSGTALAWQPVVYPIRSQNPAQQSIDAAMCYGMANRQTNVNMTREAQAPMAPKPASAPLANAGGRGQPTQPPLPASGTASASGALASSTAPANAASSTTAAGARPAMPAAAAMPGSDTLAKTDKNGMPEMGSASDAQPTTQAEVKLPPPPPPEPPMTRYWRAYGVCMQGRGYAVQ